MNMFSASEGRPSRLDRALAEGRTRVSVLRPQDLTENHLAEWRRFQSHSPALESPYLSPDFVRIVDGVRPGVLVAVAEEEGRVAGFFPFQRRGRVGKPVGGPLSDCQAVIAAPWWEWDPPSLVRAAGLSVYDFTNLRTEQRPFEPFHRAVDTSHTIDLTRGFDAYVHECRERGRDLPGKPFGMPHQAMARARSLERQAGPLRVVMHDPDPQSLRLVIAWKSEKYRRTGVPDAFAHRWTVDLLERIHATQTGAFAGMLSTLSVNGDVVAAHMGMRSASVLHWWFPVYNMAYAKFSPGLILLLEACRHAAEIGVRTIELGAGGEAFKVLVANGGVQVASGFVGSASLPLWHRQLRYGTENLAGRLPIGPAARWPGRLFRRIERLGRFR